MMVAQALASGAQQNGMVPDTPVFFGWGGQRDPATSQLKQMTDINFMRNQSNSTGSQFFLQSGAAQSNPIQFGFNNEQDGGKPKAGAAQASQSKHSTGSQESARRKKERRKSK